MTGRTHDLAAMTALGVIVLSQPLPALTLSTVIAAIFANMIGGITPDIDQPTAPFWRNLPVGKYFGRIFAAVNGGHRFLTHSLLGLALFGFAAHWFLMLIQPIMPSVDIGLVWWSFMIGMVSHLVMDSFTKEGVPWLLPLPFKFGFPPVKKFRIVTGKFGETLGVFPALLLFNVWWYGMHHREIITLLQQHIR
jgi:inner membrane protein